MPKTKNILPAKGNLFQKITVVLHVFGMYASGIIIIAIFGFALMGLSQGGDILIKTSENVNWFPGILVLLGLFFWSYVIWYSGRIIAYFNIKMYRKAPGMLFHIPRILGFYVYAVFIISFLNKPDLFIATYMNAGVILFLLAFTAFYYWLWNVGIRIFSVRYIKRYGFTSFTRIYYSVFWLYVIVIISLGLFRNTTIVMIEAASVMQVFFLFLVANRKRINNTVAPQHIQRFARALLRKMFGFAQIRVPRYEDLTFIVLNIVAVIAFVIFLLSVFWLKFSIAFGTLGVILLAFGFYTGLLNLLKVLSKVYKANILFFIILLLFIGGWVNETHNVSLINTKQADYSKRMRFRNYLHSWLQMHEAELNNDHVPIVPVIFIHSDGGASRSGYWVASVLGRLDSLTGNNMAGHLFALSGASGGSVGNATYYSLLYLKQHNKAAADSINKYGMVREAQSFLKTDFLTFTLARLLGPDIFNYIYPITGDRARALERSMEQGAGTGVLLNGFFATPFSKLSMDYGDSAIMPALCINVTRMQDGSPALISNIRLDSVAFGKRLDILSLLDKEKDIRLSTAVVLGARFPYITPAGRIDAHGFDDRGKVQVNKEYFVDGGYFDNSGAGVVQEMIMEIEKEIGNDSALITEYGSRLSKLRFVVIHINNTPKSIAHFRKAKPFVNDLAAPLITLAGSYSSQTSVNDSRLKIYINNLYAKDTMRLRLQLHSFYSEINLYDINDTGVAESYPMNWSISNATLKRMQQRLDNSPDIRQMASEINAMTRQ